ncbi:MAG: hypothetical protein ACYDA8_00995 [Deferrisomatales bacterium]
MSPLLSTLLTSLFLLCGAAAVVVMMNRLGRPGSQPSPRQLVLHRVFGWAFAASFAVLFGTMFGRFYAYWEEDPARIVFHYTASFALLLLLLLKVAIARFYPGFKKHFFVLGISVFFFAFLTVAGALSHYLVRMTQREPYISHGGISTAPDLELGKQLLIERCRTCHLLDKILQPRPAEAWGTVVDAMAKLAWPRIRPDEAQQILHYLTTTRVPRAPASGTGQTVLDEHCLICHSSAEIFARPRARQEWDAVVLQMSDMAPDLVPATRHAVLVEALLAAQAAAAVPQDPRGASGVPPGKAPPE